MLLCLSLCLGLVGGQGLDWALSFRRENKAFSPEITRALPVQPSPEEGKIDVNLASAADFERVSGIGPALAQAILAYRDSIGGFCYLEELMDVPGIGEKRFAALRNWFFCSTE